MTVVGTRPEIIRLSQVIRRLDKYAEHTVVHTGQNWDPQLSDVFFKELDLRPPDVSLDVDVSSVGAFMGSVISAIEPLLLRLRPDAFLVLGDTNSSLAALTAKRLGVPVFHMEAGNRCFDENVPEEINRRMIDHISDFNLCYTEHARRNLLAEGLHPRRLFVTGSPLPEVLQAYRSAIESSDALETLSVEPGNYLLVSMHREENVDNPANLTQLLDALVGLQKKHGIPILITAHPRLRNRLERFIPDVDISSLRLCEPFGYLGYIKLQQQARCVVSDSGTISEESAILGFPAVTIRNSMERPEALDTGSIVLSGLEPNHIARALDLVLTEHEAGHRSSVPLDYQVSDCSSRVVRLITGLSGIHGEWANLKPRLGSISHEAPGR